MNQRHHLILNLGIVCLILSLVYVAVYNVFIGITFAPHESIHLQRLDRTIKLILFTIHYGVFLYLINALKVKSRHGVTVVGLIFMAAMYYNNLYLMEAFANREISIAQFGMYTGIMTVSSYVISLIVIFTKTEFQPTLKVFGFARLLAIPLLLLETYLRDQIENFPNISMYYNLYVVTLVDLYVFVRAKGYFSSQAQQEGKVDLIE